MEIRVDNYILCSDAFSYWIMEEQPTDKTQKNVKRDTKLVRVGGFSTSLPNLLRSFKENQLKQSGARNMTELLEDLARISLDMDALNKAAIEKDFEHLKSKGKYGTEL